MPDNYQEIVDMRLNMLQQDYDAVLSATIKTDPNHFVGLEKALEEQPTQGEEQKNLSPDQEEDDGFEDF